MKQASSGPYRVPPEPRRWSAIVLAVAVHAFLLTFLWVGISWQNNKPAAVEAEVWDMKVQTAAPPPPPPAEAPEPEPEPQPEPAPAPKVVEQPAPPAPAPDIRLEQEKKRKEELRKKELAEEKKREELKAKELADKKAKEEAKKEADKKAKEEAARKEAEKKAEELKKKEAEKAEKAAKAKAEAQKKALLDKQRAQDMARMMAQAGAGTSGTAAKATAPRRDAGYEAALRAKIKSMTSYAGNTDVPGNPTVTFKVEQLPTGEIISVRKVKSSGMPEFDDAVERGISKSSPLPKKKDGTVERSLEISFQMKD
ncbi:cell envelope integrity protein TolA [Massilia solisilvae]|uniref:Cell envelope integrity protein TolA n=1 Tax=Massilia solisilvae TaxID=1811225 RepID=A0ABT2BK82_9BURK|nr:cell envelope integrity protein TolA [Massilia solisilvae]MCS0608821.1 cell envelope integrity protein TolA [Massilia solisilvae]